jgi:hypothetical protein
VPDEPHVHWRVPSRCCADEPAEQVLERLEKIKPVWESHPKDSNRHRYTRELRSEFDKRLACWEEAVAAERSRA